VTEIMRLGKLILPRWGALGREVRESARPPNTEKRRAYRVAASMPVLIYGHTAHGPFAETTATANVSRSGGLVPLSTHVIRFQKVVITNLQTDQDALCRVARLVRADDGHTLAAVEFLHPEPHFWAIEFTSDIAGEFRSGSVTPPTNWGS
jgi:hypothetical protein